MQYPGQTETEPFSRVHVWLDDTDVILGYQPLLDTPNADVRVGMRVAAVWASEAEKADLASTAEGSLLGWMPTGEPDVEDPEPREQDPVMPNSDDIAIIGWSVSPMVRNTDKTEAQMLLEVITGAVEDAGITRREVDFTCAGSCDYVAGQAFSFVQNIDAIGAWPPKRDSHVEMDGAWALYEAWLRLQLGDIDIAVAMGSGRSSTADPALIYPMEMDPYYLAPLGADAASFAALQARALIDAGKVTERQMAEVAARCRRDAQANDHAQVTGDFDVDTLLAEDYVRAPLRRHDLPPITDGAVAVVIARADKARELCDNPVWITGFAHCSELHYPGMRDLTSSPSTTLAGKAAGLEEAPVEVAELQSRVHPRGAAARRGARPRRRRRGEPVGRAARRQPDHGHRSRAHHRGRRARSATAASTARSPTRPPVRACNRTWSASSRGTNEPPTVRHRRHRADPPQEGAPRRLVRRPRRARRRPGRSTTRT